MDVTIIWDLEDDPEGNVQHIREHGVTIDEAEEVLLDPGSSRGVRVRRACRPPSAGPRPAGIWLWSMRWWTMTR
jgi:hypothetical protein